MNIGTMYCPECKAAFKNVTIRDGAVRCPVGDEVIFEFRQADEQLTPAEFMRLMDSRGVDAGKRVRRYFQAPPVKQTIYAGVFIAFVWPHLAQTFVKADADA